MYKIKTLLILVSSLVSFIKCKDVKVDSDNNIVNTGIKKIEYLNVSNCNFVEPDTSLSGIILRNTTSAKKIIGAINKIDSFNRYHFYSKDAKEMLTLTQHPGDEKNQISIFNVEIPNNTKEDYKKLYIETFKTEKGIRLGITKSELISILGDCYKTIDVTKNEIELQYLIEYPMDSKTKFLSRNNMPIYFANYEFLDDKLVSMEYGFENP